MSHIFAPTIARGKSRQVSEAALEALEKRIAENPRDVALLCARAGLLAALGKTEAAKEAYLALLTVAPAHAVALNDFGALLAATGYRSAAKTVYAQAILHHPDDPRAHVGLGNILLDEDDPAGARACYEDALRRDAALPEAHQGLARIFAASRRDADAVADHAEKGFRGHAVSVLPYHGAEEPAELLLLVAATGGNIPLKHHIDDRTFRVTAVFADFYDEESLPPHDFVFNAIGDADFCADALKAAEKLLENTSAKVLNPPAKVLRTGRVENAQRLAGIAGVRTAKTRLMKKNKITTEDLRFPALLRAPGFHTGQHFVMAEAEQDLARALEKLPGEDVFIMDYLDARGADGLCRKYRVMTVGGKLYPLHMAASADWKVHYFTALQYRDEERAFLENMAAAIGAGGVAALERVADALGLDYGGIDFGLDAAGNVLLFEANATMVVNPPAAAAPEHCKRALAEAAAAVQSMLMRAAEGGS
ncbi:MAG: hypothetical protein KGL10_00155 [Alphaproteobacteria bacterium]|nr:hypothetical protein [Alphaproteobacteria bacterium]